MTPRVIFFGTRCYFADHVLKSMSDAGIEVAARIVPGRKDAPIPCQDLQPTQRLGKRSIPLLNQSNEWPGQSTGSSHPTITINRHRASETLERLSVLEADVAIVCCYPLRLPPALMSVPRLGGINIHPSLLPAYRGPEPLFWIYRDGATKSGITIHKVDASLDTGDIVTQCEIDIPTGKPGDEMWKKSAEIASQMMLELLPDLESALHNARPQPLEDASYQSWPTSEDLLIKPGEWDAWRLFHFCRGVIPFGYQPLLQHAEASQQVDEAIGYVNSEGEGSGLSLSGHTVIRCRSGKIALKLGERFG